MIRDVEQKPGCYGLSLKGDQPTLANFLIERRPLPADPGTQGFRFRGAATEHIFRSIQELVTYYSANAVKPLQLKLRRRDIPGPAVAGGGGGAAVSVGGSPPMSPGAASGTGNQEQGALLKYVTETDALTADAQVRPPAPPPRCRRALRGHDLVHS